MSARAEATLILLASLLTGAGTAIVTLTADDGLTIDALIAPIVFLAAFGGVLFAIRAWAPKATRFLLPPVAFLTALGSIEIFRIDRDLGRVQRLWLLLAAIIAMASLRLLRGRGVEVLRRFRYLFLTGAIGLLLLRRSSWPSWRRPRGCGWDCAGSKGWRWRTSSPDLGPWTRPG